MKGLIRILPLSGPGPFCVGPLWRLPEFRMESGVRQYQDKATKWFPKWSTGLISAATGTIRRTPGPSFAETRPKVDPSGTSRTPDSSLKSLESGVSGFSST